MIKDNVLSSMNDEQITMSVWSGLSEQQRAYLNWRVQVETANVLEKLLFCSMGSPQALPTPEPDEPSEFIEATTEE